MDSEDSNCLPDFSVRHGVDLKECLEDSPDFREHLEEHEKEIGDLETGLERMVQLCGWMVSAGHKYNQTCREFGAHIKDMGALFAANGKVVELFKTTSDLFSELSSYYSVLFDQVQRSVQNAIKNFLVCEVGKLRESKRNFDRISDDHNSALHKNAQSPKSKPVEAEEASKMLQVASVTFSVVAMDHVYQINCLQSRKGCEVLEKVASLVRAQLRFFSDGCESLKKFEQVIEEMGAEIDSMKTESAKEVKKMDERHSLIKKLRSSPDSKEKLLSSPTLSSSSSDGDESVGLKGFLFKRSSNKFKMWNRRYFIMKENQLLYLKKGSTKETHVVAEDLRLCAVKNFGDIERRFCFEIVAPSKSFLLQADSAMLRKKWMAAMQASIASAFTQSMSASKAEENDDITKHHSVTTATTDPARVSQRLARVAGNDRCADCGNINPSWASINLGVLLCIECSGIHRSLGVHISKVRSVTLDAWEPEVLRVMMRLGNSIANSIFEYDVPEVMMKPVANSTRAEKEQWIKAKYVQHSFVHPHISVPDIMQTTPSVSTEQVTQQLVSINKPVEDIVADESATESEYDSKSLRRKKKQNRIRRWAMDKLVKRSISSKESLSIGRESPSTSIDGDDNSSITGSKQDLSARVLPLRERKSTFSTGDLPPPKPPRSRKVRSMAIETSVMEPLLPTEEDPASGEWYKSGSLFEKDDFCDSILEVIKNIGYTCESPGSSMLQSDTEAPAASQGRDTYHHANEEVIANGNVMEADDPSDRTLTHLSVQTQQQEDVVDAGQADDRIYEEIPDEFQRYNGDDDISVVHDGYAPPLPTKSVKEKSVSASDISLEFFSAHSSPIGSIDNYSSPALLGTFKTVDVVAKKPAKKLEAVAWSSEESSSTTNITHESPPSSKASPTANASPATPTGDTNVVEHTERPSNISVEVSEVGSGGVNKECEPCLTPGDLDTGPSYTVVKNGAAENSVSCSTLVHGNSNEGDDPNIAFSGVQNDDGCDGTEQTSVTDTASLKIGSETSSPIMARLAVPNIDNVDTFTSDDELDDSGRLLSTPEPIIIPLSKSAHEFLYSSAKSGNLPGMLCGLAHGANVNFMNPAEELKCPLIVSILAENLESTEFLLQNGAKLHLRDSRGRGCLHHAASIGAVGHVCLLLKRGTIAHLHSVDEMGKDALDIAVEQKNADIVTLLRLAKLNDECEMVDDRQNKALQETVSLVYRDIKHSTTDLIDSPTSNQSIDAALPGNSNNTNIQ